MPVKSSERIGWPVAICLVATHLGLLGAILLVNRPFLFQTGNTLRVTLPALCVIGVAQLIVLSRFGLMGAVGFRRPRPYTWLLALPLGFLILSIGARGGFLNLSGIDGKTFSVLIAAIFMVAVVEEITFRGAVLGVATRFMPQIAAVLLSSVLFGLAHALGLIAGGSAQSIAVQIGGATLFGVLLGMLRVRTDSLVPGIALHMAWNFAVLSGKPMNPAVAPEFLVAAQLLIALAVLSAIVLAVLYRRYGPVGRPLRDAPA